MVTMEKFLSGDIVWVKIPKYHWWPAKVIEKDEYLASPYSGNKSVVYVKYLNEEFFEKITDENNIKCFNCTEKSDYITKGSENAEKFKKRLVFDAAVSIAIEKCKKSTPTKKLASVKRKQQSVKGENTDSLNKGNSDQIGCNIMDVKAGGSCDGNELLTNGDLEHNPLEHIQSTSDNINCNSENTGRKRKSSVNVDTDAQVKIKRKRSSSERSRMCSSASSGLVASDDPVSKTDNDISSANGLCNHETNSNVEKTDTRKNKRLESDQNCTVTSFQKTKNPRVQSSRETRKPVVQSSKMKSVTSFKGNASRINGKLSITEKLVGQQNTFVDSISTCEPDDLPSLCILTPKGKKSKKYRRIRKVAKNIAQISTEIKPKKFFINSLSVSKVKDKNSKKLCNSKRKTTSSLTLKNSEEASQNKPPSNISLKSRNSKGENKNKTGSDISSTSRNSRGKSKIKPVSDISLKSRNSKRGNKDTSVSGALLTSKSSKGENKNKHVSNMKKTGKNSEIISVKESKSQVNNFLDDTWELPTPDFQRSLSRVTSLNSLTFDPNLSKDACDPDSDDSDMEFPEGLSPMIGDFSGLEFEGEGEEYPIDEKDVIWVSLRKNPFWPALVRKIYRKKKRITRISLVFLGHKDETPKVITLCFNPKKMLPFIHKEKDEFISIGKSQEDCTGKQKFIEAVELAEAYIHKKALGLLDIDEMSFFFNNYDEKSLIYNSEADLSLSQPSMGDREEPTIDVNRRRSKLFSTDLGHCDRISKKEQDRQQKMKEKQEALVSHIKSEETKTFLLAIRAGKKESERHEMFFSGRTKLRQSIRHAGFGPISDEEQQEDIINTLLEWITEEDNGVKKSLPNIDYLLDVWIPEAVVYSLMKVKKYCRSKAWEQFDKGVRMSKEEKQSMHLSMLRGAKNVSPEERLRHTEKVQERLRECGVTLYPLLAKKSLKLSRPF